MVRRGVRCLRLARVRAAILLEVVRRKSTVGKGMSFMIGVIVYGAVAFGVWLGNVSYSQDHGHDAGIEEAIVSLCWPIMVIAGLTYLLRHATNRGR